MSANYTNSTRGPRQFPGGPWPWKGEPIIMAHSMENWPKDCLSKDDQPVWLHLRLDLEKVKVTRTEVCGYLAGTGRNADIHDIKRWRETRPHPARRALICGLSDLGYRKLLRQDLDMMLTITKGWLVETKDERGNQKYKCVVLGQDPKGNPYTILSRDLYWNPGPIYEAIKEGQMPKGKWIAMVELWELSISLDPVAAQPKCYLFGQSIRGQPGPWRGRYPIPAINTRREYFCEWTSLPQSFAVKERFIDRQLIPHSRNGQPLTGGNNDCLGLVKREVWEWPKCHCRDEWVCTHIFHMDKTMHMCPFNDIKQREEVGVSACKSKLLQRESKTGYRGPRTPWSPFCRPGPSNPSGSEESDNERDDQGKMYSGGNQTQRRYSGGNQTQRRYSGANQTQRRYSGANQTQRRYSGANQTQRRYSGDDQTQKRYTGGNESQWRYSGGSRGQRRFSIQKSPPRRYYSPPRRAKTPPRKPQNHREQGCQTSPKRTEGNQTQSAAAVGPRASSPRPGPSRDPEYPTYPTPENALRMQFREPSSPYAAPPSPDSSEPEQEPTLPASADFEDNSEDDDSWVVHFPKNDIKRKREESWPPSRPFTYTFTKEDIDNLTRELAEDSASTPQASELPLRRWENRGLAGSEQRKRNARSKPYDVRAPGPDNCGMPECSSCSRRFRSRGQEIKKKAQSEPQEYRLELPVTAILDELDPVEEFNENSRVIREVIGGVKDEP
ncbi:hypothetical protein WMY93_002411 [Mugilogobius chulae]|uniref:Uncharacterized protein n=1 Tax=Mugilogobius chulae TaxID=88201 RepID=A0AAW0PUA8_9GOBI